MRIFISTFIDAPDGADVQKVISTAINGLVYDDSVLNSMPGESFQLLSNCQYTFSDDSDKEQERG